MTDLYSTQSAAAFLGASEASVRRWSDAGLLPVKRHGRRGTRRFRERDLRDFAARQHGATPPATTAGGTVTVGPVQLPVHSHLPTLYDSDAGRFRLSLPLLAEGLRAGVRCLLIADGGMAEAYVAALGGAGVDVDQAVATGRLEIAAQNGASVKAALQTAESFLWRATSEGGGVPRLVGEMTSERTAFPTDGDMLDYEFALNAVTQRFPCVVLCQYDVRGFDGETVMGALKAHPDLFSLRLADVLL